MESSIGDVGREITTIHSEVESSAVPALNASLQLLAEAVTALGTASTGSEDRELYRAAMELREAYDTLRGAAKSVGAFSAVINDQLARLGGPEVSSIHIPTPEALPETPSEPLANDTQEVAPPNAAKRNRYKPERPPTLEDYLIAKGVYTNRSPSRLGTLACIACRFKASFDSNEGSETYPAEIKRCPSSSSSKADQVLHDLESRSLISSTPEPMYAEREESQGAYRRIYHPIGTPEGREFLEVLLKDAPSDCAIFDQ